MSKKTKEKVEIILNELSIKLIDIGEGDLQKLAQVHESFKQLKDISGLPEIWKSDVIELMDIVEKIILDECSFEEGMQQISQLLECLQNKLLETETEISGKEATDTQDGKIASDKIKDDEIIMQFLQGQPLKLEEFEELILEAEKGNKEAVKGIRRYLHTWKGEAGMLNLRDLQDFFHNVESQIEKNTVSIDGLFAVKDFLTRYFKVLESGEIPKENKNEINSIYDLFDKKKKSKTSKEKKPKEKEKCTNSEANIPSVNVNFSGDTSLLLDFICESKEHLHNSEVILMNIESNPEDKDELNALFRVFHTIKGVSGFVGLCDITELAHKAETMLDKARKGEITLTDAHIDVSFDSVDMLKLMVENAQNAIETKEYKTPEGYSELLHRIDNPEAEPGRRVELEGSDKKIGEQLVELGKATNEIVGKALDKQKLAKGEHLGEILVKEGAVKPRDIAEAIRSQRLHKKEQEDTGTLKVDTTIKVSTKRLDNLIDMVGELVIANSMVAQSEEIRESRNHKLTRNVAHLGKIVRELQENSMSLRMVSVKTTFQKMARLVRDLARKNNKRVNFEMYGEDTELDRNVVEEIGDPLIHMVRNAVDHGIESPEKRRAAGKPECGTVKLNAYHKGGNVVIEIQDDGKGLNRERIIEKAINMGVIRSEDAELLSEQEAYNLIFHPGLSTAKKVSDVSGRGVGMDVVKKNIESLRGRVDIVSEPGKGSTFLIMLPLTLAIIDGMIVRVGKEKFIIPTISVQESLRPTDEQITDIVGKGKVISLRGNLLPLFHLDKVLEIPGATQNPCDGLVIVLGGAGENPRGFVIDELLGQQQVVIKSIGKGIGEITGISGGAILGDGKVGLILDPTGIVKIAENKKNGKAEKSRIEEVVENQIK